MTDPEVTHKAVVEPVFLGYNRVSSRVRISLIQIVVAVAQTVENEHAVDTVQLMKTGWWIYLQTSFDHIKLVESGITLNGQHVSLRVDPRPGFKKTVHITVKDLLLHIIDNVAVLEMISSSYSVASDMQYATV